MWAGASVGEMTNATTSPVYTNATTSLVVSMITNATTNSTTNATNASKDPNLAAVMYLLGYGGSEGANPWVVVGVVVSLLLLAAGVLLTVYFVRLKNLERSYTAATLMGGSSWAPCAPPLIPMPPRLSMPLMPNSASMRGGGARVVRI
jgi:hypothetical protein